MVAPYLCVKPHCEPQNCCGCNCAQPSPAYYPGQMRVIDMANRVCKQLPDGWELLLCMEKGAAWVRLIDPDSDEAVLPDSADKSLERQINDALCVANGWPIE